LKLTIKKLAAIDIGSNAIRLLISNVIQDTSIETPIFKKSALIRVPIRLGSDTFLKGEISKENTARMLKAMKAFKLLMEIHNVEDYKACATSAMREATNGQEVVKQIAAQTGIQIDIIDGKEEAAIIFSTDLSHFIEKNNSYLYVDVGGGSTEFTIFSGGQIINSKSFKIGTVRLLKMKAQTTPLWNQIEQWIKTNTKDLKNIHLIGSGGNINKIFKLSRKPYGTPLSFMYMKAHYNYLEQLTYNQRILKLGLNSDRADVILPATKIYLNAMEWSGALKIFVPKIGLSDGIIKGLHYKRL